MAVFVPIFIAVVILFGFIKKVPVFDAFTEGAKSGLHTLHNISTTLVGLIFAINMLSASGLMEVICKFFVPFTDLTGFPSEVIPMVLLRPVSGGGSTALLTNIFNEYGPDSFPGLVASVLAGSTETTFYATAVYFGSVKVTKIRHTLVAALIADFVAAIMAVVTVNWILV